MGATGAARRSEPRERPGAARSALVLTALALVLAGCSLVTGEYHVQQQLRSDGIGRASFQYETANGAERVDVTVPANGTTASQEASQVASVIWATLPGSFDVLAVTVRGHGTHVYTHDQLESMFGARPNGLDDEPISQQLASARRTGSLVLVCALLLLVGLVVLMVLLVRRGRRRQERRRQALMMTHLPPEVWAGVAEQGTSEMPRPGAPPRSPPTVPTGAPPPAAGTPGAGEWGAPPVVPPPSAPPGLPRYPGGEEGPGWGAPGS